MICHAIIAMHAGLCRLFLFVKHDAQLEPTVSLHDHSDRGQLTLQLLLLLMPTCITSMILMFSPERNISNDIDEHDCLIEMRMYANGCE